jgi:DNA polymerase
MPSVENCPGCPYGGPAIGPRGKPTGRIVLVGEAPGKTEIERGCQFVGRAGGVLSQAIADAGLREADLFITNSIACRPQPVRPWVKAIDACRGRLLRDLEAHPRAVVVALGATALRAVTGKRDLRILKARTQGPISTRGWLVVPTVHPALGAPTAGGISAPRRGPPGCRTPPEDLAGRSSGNAIEARTLTHMVSALL